MLSTIAVVTAAVAVATVPAAASRVGDAGTPPSDAPLLAVVQATKGSLRGVSDGGIGRLVLSGVDGAAWFTDRPMRDAGTFSLAEFEDRFFGDGDPPNAALELSGASEQGDVVILELSNPRINRKASRLTLGAKVIDPSTATRFRAGSLLDRSDAGVAERFDEAALFVDDAASCQADANQITFELSNLVSTTCADAQAAFAALAPCFSRPPNEFEATSCSGTVAGAPWQSQSFEVRGLLALFFIGGPTNTQVGTFEAFSPPTYVGG